MNGTATHQWTIVYDTSHRSYVEDKLSKKKHFTPYLETPEISPPKGEKLRPDNRSTIVHTFTPIGGICAEISVPETSSCIFTYKDTKKELQQMIYMTKRILALRLSYNNERLRSRYGTTDGQKASQRASC